MASGTITGSTGNEYIDAKIEWSSSKSTSTNSSSVSAILYYKRNNTGFTTTGTGTFSITINGTTKTVTKTLTITENTWVAAAQATVTVNHSSDGSKSITISASGSIPDTTLTSTNVSGTAKLDTIARESLMRGLSCATTYFTGELTYKYKTQNASFYNRCNIAVYDGSGFAAVKSINLGQQSTSEKTATVTLSEDELSIVYNALPDTDYGRIRFTLRTYSKSDYTGQIGDGDYADINLYIPNTTATQPTATMTLTPVNSLGSPFNTLYIRGKTKVKGSFSNAAGKYGASIVSYKYSVDGVNYGDPYTSNYLITPGSVTVKGTITDSRGFSRTYEQIITVLSYDAPTIIPASGESKIICARCDASGNLSDSGTYLKIKAKRSYSPVISSGVQKNFCSIRYRYKVDGGTWSDWVTILDGSATSDEVSTGALLDGTLDPTKSYSFRVSVVDTLGESGHTSIPVPTDKVYMHKAGSINAFALGKYAEEENSFDVAQDITAIFRGPVKFAGEAWLSLGLSENVTEPGSSFGRWGGSGCYYRVCAGDKHIYVAFNCGFTYEGSAIQVNADPIPAAYRPDRNVYAICAIGGRSIARILVNSSGNILVDWIQNIASAEQTTTATVKWIDGYIDYWT